MMDARMARGEHVISTIERQNLKDPFPILAGLFACAMDAIITADSEQNIVLFNPAAETAFGYTAEQVLGKPLEILIPVASRAAHRGHVERFGQSGATERSMKKPAILKAVRSDGSEFPIEATIAQAEAGGSQYYTVILRDVAERLESAAELERRQQLITQLSVPVLQVREHVLLVPIVGELDKQRAQQLTDQLLRNIRERRARVAVIDLTGVATVDSVVANHLIMTAEAARLLGAQVIVTGISRAIAHTLVQIGSNFNRLRTCGDLQSGIDEAIRLLGLATAA